MVPSVKLVSPISGLISERKNGGNFFPEKDHTGGKGQKCPKHELVLLIFLDVFVSVWLH